MVNVDVEIRITHSLESSREQRVLSLLGVADEQVEVPVVA